MILTVNELKVEVRPGTPDHVLLLLDFIREMAAFEKLTTTATADSLQDALFAEPPAAHTLLVFVGGTAIGYAIYFFSFSSMMGRRALWLDDLYIVPAFRGKGIGKALMAYLARIAIDTRCARFEWIVLDWNTSAIEFYKGLGATIMPDWRVCRLAGEQLAGVAKGVVTAEGDE